MNKYNNFNKQNEDFMSLSKISYGYDLNPKWASDKWLSEPSTLEFIQLWESLHNLDFKKKDYIDLCSCALSKGTSPNVEELQNNACIKSMFVDRKYDGEIFLHKDIAMDFASWASPAFRTFCLLSMQDTELNSSSNFRSEEDFIVSAKNLALYTQKAALKKYKQKVISENNLKDYEYYIKGECNKN